eukprot:CAMPEP_0172441230 /NCGR_PEP_ID=MMETSP1065-20121228/1801_1 /TAXON_ID=265537 /ORGANISM="Amphiprora paludosa, Strain CCMP125" /LENGTH=218 /DNA_ID=CAMNT_0013190485 /DNA_START=22 /DNA_END=678 /DNA_ORIENTATION=-
MTLTAMATVLLATMLVPINALAFAAPPITPFSCCSHLLPQQQPPPIVETTKTERMTPLQTFWNDMATHGQAYFQLEEKEDAESCTTELCLRSDHTLQVGETNGPRYIEAVGVWQEYSYDSSSNNPQQGLETNLHGVEFEMRLTRTFETGREKRDWTNVGRFHYSVERTLTGSFTFVGANVNVEGMIHDGEGRHLGYFSLMDVTQQRERVMEGQLLVSS